MHRLLLCGLLCLAAATAHSQDNARTLTPARMWALQRLGNPAITPDGRQAVVPVTRYDVAENRGFTDLWLVPTAGGAAPGSRTASCGGPPIAGLSDVTAAMIAAVRTSPVPYAQRAPIGLPPQD